MSEQFTINQERLEEVCSVIYETAKSRHYIFRNGFKHFLPQWTLPQELEHNPQQTKSNNPLDASKFLWTEAFMERVNVSSTVMRNSLKTWSSQEKRWIFFPEEVAEKSLSDIEQILRGDLQFNSKAPNENPAPVRYKNNAIALTEYYNADPRKLLDNLTVEQSRKNLMRFEGIGTGIANLYIIYLIDREIVQVLDPQNVLLKVDIHKGRIPINTDCITTSNHRIHRNAVIIPLENGYLQASQNKNLDPALLDSALWVLGSEGCARRDYSFCKANCPLADTYCTKNIRADKNNGYFEINNGLGKRIDTRKGKGQTHFDFLSAP